MTESKVGTAYAITNFKKRLVEGSGLADKLSKRAKDASTRKFLQTMLLPRKLKYNRSTFYLDFFHLSSWNLTNEIPSDKIKGALIVKNTSERPMTEIMDDEPTPTAETSSTPAPAIPGLPEDYYLSSLKEFVPTTITIAFECEYPGLYKVTLPLIKKDRDRTVSGVTIADNIDWDNID